jgi:hypothetical protein
MTTTAAGLRALDQARDAYEADGYTVRYEERLPPPFRGFVADAVALRNDEVVVVEVRPADMSDQTRNRLSSLAEIVAAEDGWRVDIVTYEPEATPGDPERADIFRRVEEARRVADISPDAAVILTWSAIEGALLRRSRARGLVDARAGSPRTLIRSLNINGLLSDNQAAELDGFAKLRNDVAHGLRADPPEPDRLDWLARFALAAADEDPATVEGMVEWFREHDATPEDVALSYDNEDGKYVWFGSRPHDAGDVLQAEFDLALETDIAEAVKIIECDGYDWARRE